MSGDGLVIRVVHGPSLGAWAEVNGDVVVGRAGDLVVDDPTVSRTHARIARTGGGDLEIVDLGSASGVELDGRPLRGTATLHRGDRIGVGSSMLAVLQLVRFHDLAAEPALRVRGDGAERVVAIADGMTIGRDPGCDVRIDDPRVSRVHARIGLGPTGPVLEDLRSGNGTTVDGRAVRDRAQLADGAVVEVGGSDAQLRVSTGRGTGGSVAVRVRREGSARAETVLVDAAPHATVAEVTADLATAVGAGDGAVLAYRSGDGVLLHPDDRWAATGTRRGDEIVIGAGDATALAARPGRSWPSPQARRLNQLPRTIHPPAAHKVARIDAPESTSLRGRGLIWQIVGGLGAIGMGLGLAVVRPEYAVFGLITGCIGIVTIGASILGDQSRRRHKVARYRARLAALDAELADVRRRQAAALAALSPDGGEVERWLADLSPRIWERSPQDGDALVLTIGTGSRAARIEVERATLTDSPLVAELEAVVARHRVLERVPVTGPTPAAGSLGVAGLPEHVIPLLASFVLEAATQLPPDQLRIRVLAGDERWAWTEWLPHVRSLTTDPTAGASLVGALTAELGEPLPAGRTADVLDLVVLTEPVAHLDLAPLLRAIAGRGLLVAAATDRRDLPSGLAAVVEVDASGSASVSGALDDPPLGPVAVRGVTEARAESVAVALGQVRQRGAVSAPEGLVELLGLGSATSVDVAAAWARPIAEPLTIEVGSDDAGSPVTVGFRADGPHGMIAGTTGSGKSELLQTLLAGLALTHPPERLSMFLIDFKGGATFAPLAPLPHVVGLVTDLENDSALARRAFTALDAEIERRKRALDAARVPNIIEYERLSGVPPMPNLLVVIDEFALLVERQPEVKDRLDTVATQGRSLGIHLMLATQSPSGVITHAIRTNTNLWICLRVVSDSESVEILGTRDAARIPDRSPGRAIVRLGAGDQLRPFQAARIGRPLPQERRAVRVRTRDGRDVGIPDAVASSSTTELAVVVDRIVAAADERGTVPPAPLWLPPLPAVLPADDLPELSAADVDGGHLVARLGLCDLPARQVQELATIDLTASGNAMFCGLLGYGRTTALVQVGTDLARAWSPADLHLYAVDSGTGSLGALDELPHTGAVVGANDLERLGRLLDRLAGEVDARRDRLAAAGVGDFVRYRQGGRATSFVVLLVDDYPALREAAEQHENGRLVERFSALLQNGPAVGIHVVVAVNQSVDLRLREQSLVPSRFVFRAADTSDYSLVELRVRPGDHPVSIPGRAVGLGGVEIHVASADRERIGAIAASWSDVDASLWPRAVDRLPVAVEANDVPMPDRGIALGLGGPEVSPVVVDLDGPLPSLLVAGPIQSGRSSTLVTLLTGHRAHHPDARCLVVAPRPSPLRQLVEDDLLRVAATPDDILDGLDLLGSDPHPGDLLVVDDGEALSSVLGAGERVEAMLRNAAERGIRVVVGLRSSDLPGMFDAWVRYLVSLRRAVLLQPAPDDAFVFGIKLPAIPPPVCPGRGLLVEGPHATVVQVAQPAPIGLPID